MITNTLYDLLPIFWMIVGILIFNKIAESEWFDKLFGG